MSHDHFDLESARAAADRDGLDAWVREFLASPGSDNAELADILDDRLGWWAGPLRLPIDQLHRLAGPPGDPVMCAVDDDFWRDDVEELGAEIEDGLEPAPVIVAFRDSRLELEDGNHRVEALRRAGEDHSWAVVGFESVQDRDRFLQDRGDPADRRRRAARGRDGGPDGYGWEEGQGDDRRPTTGRAAHADEEAADRQDAPTAEARRG